MSPQRRDVLTGLAGLGTAALAPSWLPTLSDSLSPLALERPSEQLTSGTLGYPVWHVRYTDGSRDPLAAWAGDHDERTIRHEFDDLNAMSISAPARHIGLGWWDRATDSGLQGNSYVERIDAQFATEWTGGLTRLPERSDWRFDTPPTRPWASTPSDEGVAFRDDVDSDTPVADTHEFLSATTHDHDGFGYTVAIIDTGVNAGSLFETDTDLNRILGSSKNILTGETVDEDGLDAVEDADGHGTWVASALAGNSWSNEQEFQGLLPASDLLAYKALDDDGSGSTEDIVAAVEHATAQEADVICMSLGSPLWSDALDDALDHATSEGSIPVVAVGNDRLGSTWTASPADSEHCISVTAISMPDSGNPDDAQSAAFANVGPDPGTADFSGGASAGATPDVAAPGMELTALVHNTRGGTSEQTLSGTSMAAPLVAGCVARLMEATGLREFDEVSERLFEHARPLERVAAAEVEHGLVDLAAAVEETDRDEQDDAMNSTATDRDQAFRSLSNAQGGFLTGLF